MLFFAPDLYEEMDWSKTPDSLEQELHRIFPKWKKGTKYTDKLMKVPLKSSKEQWVLVHVEVQADEDNDFSKRMFQYFYRIFDKYNKNIYAIALLADPTYTFKPTAYEYQFHGTHLTYAYNAYKFLDQDEEKLLQSDNPFAYVVLAGIYMQKSRNDADKRYQFKRRLFELLLQDPEKNAREYVHSLLYFIDYVLQIPEDMSKKLQEEVKPMIGKEANDMDKTKHPDPPTLKPLLDELRQEGKELGRREGIAEGQRERTKEIAVAMLKEGIPIESIMKVTGLNDEELSEIKSRM
ncbi:Rpn family recombination-promoting nuclease/putative transposase [Salicibibacter cibarius]|uniref:Rpn family recombination-promoting nuclease/putative transposase n=1 Tax=Salicibibacter cibarius TaxID=2743000 RepID=A0A7T6Z1P5_9BACI|nr:Rpn family recombination-promoting nuclease/putative transposase [Salicibibacter cibarius]QQK75331.1 Rpn family recombination-promoting nuclease/putative transposase [Salicibibacter cibarius]